MTPKKIFFTILTIFIAIFIAVGAYFITQRTKNQKVKAAEAVVTLTTNQTSLTYPSDFTVVIYVDTKGLRMSATDLELQYDPNVLEAISITNANFLPVILLPQKINATAGTIRLVLGSDPTNPKSGTGILANAKFRLKNASGTTQIKFTNNFGVAAVGSATNVASATTPLSINIATNAITPSPSPTPTATPITSPTKSPSPSPSQVPSGPVKGDVNGDGHVNIIDIGIIIDNYGQTPPTNPKADVTGDGIVNIIDIGIAVDNYGL